MTCLCSLCDRDREFRQRLSLIPESEREYWEGIYSDLDHAELDRDVAQAVIDGSWPYSNQYIKETRQAVRERKAAAKAVK